MKRQHELSFIAKFLNAALTLLALLAFFIFAVLTTYLDERWRDWVRGLF